MESVVTDAPPVKASSLPVDAAVPVPEVESPPPTSPTEPIPTAGPPPVAAPEPGTLPPKPKRVTAPRRVNSLMEIDQALQASNGNRREAAKLLCITVDQLKCRIHDNDILRQKWNRDAMNDRARLEFRASQGMAPKVQSQVTSVATRALMDATQNLMTRLNAVNTRQDRVRKRIEMAEAVIFGEEGANPQHAFKYDLNGRPAEEKMLRDADKGLTEQAMQIVVESRNAMESICRIEAMQKQLNASGGMKRAKPGFDPKSQIVELQRGGE